MKNNTLAIVLLATLISQASLASPTAAPLQKCANSSGNVIMDKVTLGCMTINGTASTNGTTFTGDLIVTGPLKSTQTKFTGLNVTGPVSLENCQVSGEAHIMGPLSALSTTFQKKLTLNADNILLSETTAQDIVIESTTPTTVILNNSNVNGDITFRYAHGNVTSNKSNLKGKIIQPSSLTGPQKN